VRKFAKQRIWNNGKQWSPEIKDNISKGMRKYWAEMCDEARKCMIFCSRYHLIVTVNPMPLAEQNKSTLST
jgi:hypothetical protein